MKILAALLFLSLSLTATCQKKKQAVPDSINLFISFYAKGQAITGNSDFGNTIFKYNQFPTNKEIIRDLVKFQPKLRTFNAIVILSIIKLNTEEAKRFFQ